MSQVRIQEPMVPADCVALEDYERHAKARLPEAAWAYLTGFGGDGLTRRRNRQAFDALELAGRVLVDMKGANTALELLGLQLDLPVILAPVAYQRLAHPDGELATALGAAAARVLMTLSVQSSTLLEDVAASAQGPLWFQLYFQAERRDSLGLVRRAEQAGFRALVVTVDTPVNGVRNAEQRAAFRLPHDCRPVNLDGIRPVTPQAGPGQSPVFRGMLDRAPTWDDIAWLRDATRLPLLLKGITHPDDALKALTLGVDGIVVSNHGGRALDTLPASLESLRAIAPAVAGQLPLIVDGGIRRGTDVLKALALGARAVMIGQPIVHALAVAGAVGVIHMLTILRVELEVAMALTGCRTMADIGPHALWQPAR
ncbi:alpha-hydroxy acid oxidase [Zavarzinia sp. CC-PAN008]|uniref:alpha-hydroxy acid oxidase n=1 Tax=Zavarzinia sp. CC-PAN008 TaxID=3243332 RepID=UPI003F743851